jgi:hypothetical protein
MYALGVSNLLTKDFNKTTHCRRLFTALHCLFVNLVIQNFSRSPGIAARGALFFFQVVFTSGCSSVVYYVGVIVILVRYSASYLVWNVFLTLT